MNNSYTNLVNNEQHNTTFFQKGKKMIQGIVKSVRNFGNKFMNFFIFTV